MPHAQNFDTRRISKILRPVAGSPLQFETTIGGRRVKFKPVNQSWKRYAAFSTIA